MLMEFKLPELGENIETADVVNVLVKVGDTLQKDQPVVELETEKAAFEVPSTVSGKIQEIRVKAGDKVKVGQVLLLVEAAAASPQAEAPKEIPKKEPIQKEAAPPPTPPPQPPAEKKTEEQKAKAPTTVSRPGKTEDIPASPIVRRIAREMGVNLGEVQGSGPGGRISVEDLVRFARQGPAEGPGLRPAAPPLPDFTKWGSVERKPMTNVRRTTAEHVGRSWSVIPHVTQFDKADITELEQLRKRFSKRVEEAGGHLSVTAIVLKVAASALKVFPQMNASIDLEKEEIVYKNYFHIGIAVATDRGLIVPVIRDVDKKNIMELAVELNQVAEKARNKKTTIEEMKGASFSITNLGNIGGSHFTPIINWPEVAILGVGRAGMEPIWIDGKFEPRMMLPLSLSYDHRLVDGADGARFLRWLADAVTEPFLMDLEG